VRSGKQGFNKETLLEELRSLRRNLAQTNRVQDSWVFSNGTLEAMATILPMTPQEMLAINGVGRVKMERYGPDFLRVIRERVGVDANQKNPQPQPRANSAQLDNRDGRISRPSNATEGQLLSDQQLPANHQAPDPRQRYPAEYRTSDGHYVRSRAEAMIDDWLYHRHIAHAYERKLPVEDDAISDFYLPQGDVYVEFWGKKDDQAYARRMQEKQEIYKRHNLRLISLTDTELYRLDDHMPRLLRSYGVQLT
jgi:hypothetical protein